MILLTLMLMTVILPMVALAIDFTVFNVVQSKLSAAVDGAALGAGRLIGTQANTEEIANEFLRANFQPPDFWGAYDLQPEIAYTQPTITSHRIRVVARVKVHRLFASFFDFDVQGVAAAAEATRRDSRVVMVLDRSGSMGSQIQDLKGFATAFTKKFTPGVDQLGLVVFGSGAIVAYPRLWPYDFSPSGDGGPDDQFWDEKPTACTSDDMVCSLNQMTGGGGTGMAEGLYLAYLELQKAHNRAMAQHGEDDRVNVVVLFTDGMPNMFPVHLNSPDPNQQVHYSLKTAGSTCTYNPYDTTKWATPAAMPEFVPADGKPTSSTKLIGIIGAWGNYPSWLGSGFIQRPTTDPTVSHNVEWWLKNPAYYENNNVKIKNGVAITNCSRYTSFNASIGNQDHLGDLSRIPPVDVYGNSTDSSTSAWIYSISYKSKLWPYNSAITPTRSTGGYHLALAAWTLVDNIANTIRADQNMTNRIYTIGYKGNDDQGRPRLTDADLLRRVANSVDAPPQTITTQQVGKYYEADQVDEIGEAMMDIASEVLRLSR